jgi:hypothetical protein
MPEAQIRFDDGAAYERMMGRWSRLAGKIFLDWLGPRSGLRWIDVGCGNGVFSELLVESCAPARFWASILPKLNSLLRGHGPRPGWRSFDGETPWRCHARITALMQP